ncbi:hypothetical protein VNI00_011462 [Paramarasmius palmivorus]|uniref:Uncharacterized protein n=1 Tax=Paramarasmius palmivorus TaxID=297713 RepID=A0AAW0CFA0_9AGAR
MKFIAGLIAFALILPSAVLGGEFVVVESATTIAGDDSPTLGASLVPRSEYGCDGFMGATQIPGYDEGDTEFSDEVCGKTLDFKGVDGGLEFSEGGTVLGTCTAVDSDESTICTETGLDQTTFDEVWACSGDDICN